MQLFLAIIHTPNLLNHFLAFILSFCQNNMIYRFLQHASCFMCVPCLDLCVYVIFAMFYAQIYILTCLYVQIYMLRALCYVFLCSVPLSFKVDVRVTRSHTCMMLLAMPFLDLCVYVFISMLYGQILVFTCLYSWIYACLYAYAYIYTSTYLCVWIYALYMFHVIFHVLVRSMPCLRAQTQAMFVMPCASVAILLLYLSFLCFGLLVRSQYRPCALYHRPYTKAHIKGFRSSYLHVYACLLLCFMLVLASLVIGFATPLVGLCLCGYIRHP